MDAKVPYHALSFLFFFALLIFGRSKVIERGLNGSKIEILSFQPGVVKDYRLGLKLST